MLISTAAVHGGASGGALLCPTTGQLLGLVTSNARHVRGSTLPRLNFCIPAAQLAPVWTWAQQHEEPGKSPARSPTVSLEGSPGGSPAGFDVRQRVIAGGAGAPGPAPGSREALQLLDVQGDDIAAKIWALKSPMAAFGGASRGGPGPGGSKGLGAVAWLMDGQRQRGTLSKL
jgi:hypothetical protein